MGFRRGEQEGNKRAKRGKLKRVKFTSPKSPPFSTFSPIFRTRESTSPNPRFAPCPARGWTRCAESPTRTSPGAMYLSLWDKDRGKLYRLPAWRTIFGGKEKPSSVPLSENLEGKFGGKI